MSQTTFKADVLPIPYDIIKFILKQTLRNEMGQLIQTFTLTP